MARAQPLDPTSSGPVAWSLWVCASGARRRPELKANHSMSPLRRHWLCALLLLTAAGVGATRARSDEPAVAEEAPVGQRLAEGAVAAWKARDVKALSAIANDPREDAWVVADELLGTGQVEVARALASALLGADERSELVAWLTAHGSQPEIAGWREAYRKASAAEDVGGVQSSLEGLFSAAAPTGPGSAILRVRAAALLASALRGQDDGDAEVAWRRCLDLARGLGWSRMELGATHQVVALLEREQRIEEASVALDAVMPLCRRPVGWEEIGDVLLDRGAMYARAKQWAEAGVHFAKAAGAFHAAHSAGGEALALAHQAATLLDSGRLVEALALLDRADPLAKQSGDVATQATLLQRRSAVFEAVGMLERARALLSDARKTYVDVGELTERREAALEGSQGRAAFLAGAYADALRHFQACEKLYSELGAADRVQQAVAHEAWVEAEGTPTERTMARLRDLMASPMDGASAEERVIAAEALARCLMRAGRPEEAVVALRSIQKYRDGLDNDSTLRMDTAGMLGAALVAAGRAAEATGPLTEYVDGMVGHVDALEVALGRTYRGVVADEALTAGVAAARSLGDLERLWRFLEASRAIRLLAALGGRTTLDELLVPEALRGRVAEARARFEEARRAEALASREGPPGGPSQLRELQRDATKRREAAAEEVKLSRAKLDMHELEGGARLLALEQARLALAPDGSEAILQLSLRTPGDAILSLLVLRQGAPVVAAVPRRADILSAAGVLRGDPQGGRSVVLERPAAGPPGASLQTPAEALASLESLLARALAIPSEVRTLYVVPEGALAYIPYLALWPDRDVALLPAASLLLHAKGLQRRSGTKALAVGVSDYGAEALMREAATLAGLSSGTRGSLERGALRPLPHAAAEAKSVAGTQGTPLIDGAATARALLGALAGQQGVTWSTIHFACHGLLDPNFPALSGLALHDGILTAQEIFPMRLRTDMVVLSACSTAADPYVLGEGVTGLVRAFLQADAARVVASLWPVPDEPTAVLMGEFYRVLREGQGTTAASALRRAQLHVRTAQDGRWAAPGNWAGWVVWGAP